MARRKQGLFSMLFGNGHWKVTIPLLVGISVYDHFVPGTIKMVLEYVFEMLKPMLSLLLLCFVVYVALKFLRAKHK